MVTDKKYYKRIWDARKVSSYLKTDLVPYITESIDTETNADPVPVIYNVKAYHKYLREERITLATGFVKRLYAENWIELNFEEVK